MQAFPGNETIHESVALRQDVEGLSGVSFGTVSKALTVNGGREAGEQIVGMPAAHRPTAAVCANDLLALGLLQEKVRHGIRVPDDLAIVGFDDIDFAAAVPLSSVRKPRFELGRRAAQLLLDEARNPDHRHEQLLFEPRLVVRESSMVRRTEEQTP